MSNPPKIRRAGTFKQISLGQSVILDDQYLVENDKDMRIQAIAVQTMENAERIAQEIMQDARKKAEQLMAATQQQAAQILEEEGYKKVEAIQQQAYQEGFEAGVRDGVNQIREELADKIRAADLILEKAFEAERLIINKQQNQIVELLHHILTLILNEEIKTNPSQILSMLEQAAEQIQSTGTAKVILHPDTYHMLRDFSPQTATALENLQRITFHTDLSCTPLEMYLETVDNTYDISPETQAKEYVTVLGENLLSMEDYVDQRGNTVEEIIQTHPHVESDADDELSQDEPDEVDVVRDEPEAWIDEPEHTPDDEQPEVKPYEWMQLEDDEQP